MRDKQKLEIDGGVSKESIRAFQAKGAGAKGLCRVTDKAGTTRENVAGQD